MITERVQRILDLLSITCSLAGHLACYDSTRVGEQGRAPLTPAASALVEWAPRQVGVSFIRTLPKEWIAGLKTVAPILEQD